MMLSSTGGPRKPFRNTNSKLRRILTNTRIVVMVGASDKEDRASNEVMKILLDHGYRVIPVNPRLKGQQLMGERVLGSLEELIPNVLESDRSSKDSDDAEDNLPGSRSTLCTNVMVDIFRRSEHAGEVVDQAIALGRNIVSSVWMQIGVIDKIAAQRAQDAGLDVAMNVCPAEEIPRLRIPAKMAKETQLGKRKSSTPHGSGRSQDQSMSLLQADAKRRKRT